MIARICKIATVKLYLSFFTVKYKLRIKSPVEAGIKKRRKNITPSPGVQGPPGEIFSKSNIIATPTA